jgi:hypothetical protein
VTTLLVGPEDLRKGHCVFLGIEPTPKQLRIYNAFPASRGVADARLDVENFEAAVIMALVQTFSMKTQPEPYRCYLFVPSSHEKWAVTQLGNFAVSVFKILKEKKAAARAQSMGKAFHAVLLGCRVFQFPQVPDRWVAFGFAKSDPMPDWMMPALTTADPCP